MVRDVTGNSSPLPAVASSHLLVEVLLVVDDLLDFVQRL